MNDNISINWDLLKYEGYAWGVLERSPQTPKNFWVKGFWGSICTPESLSIPPWGPLPHSCHFFQKTLHGNVF